MEGQLRARIESLVSISKHPIRSIEHKTFKRLLYRNRSQHRHGFYFRKLDHVRRLLSQIDRHMAWESIQYSLGDTDGRGSQPKGNHPLSISSLTVDDLKSIESLFDKLVTSAIIEAARRVVTDLVSREHFLPFAVSVLATLARLFVLERKVLSEVRGVGMEMKLLFTTDGLSRPSKENIKDNVPLPNEEDIGLEVPASEEGRKSPKDDQALQLIPDPSSCARDGNTPAIENELPHGKGILPSEQDVSAAREPSLYHLIAKHVPTTRFSVDVRTRISVSLPEVLGRHQQFESISTSNVGAKATMNEATSPERTFSPPSQQIAREHTGDASPDDVTQLQRLPEGASNKMVTKSQAGASDSDDIDDIFDALENS